MQLLSINARRVSRWLLTVLLLLACAVASGLIRAQSATEEVVVGSVQAPMVIGTRQVPPFAMRGADGRWSGIAIDLWAQIAERLGLEYQLVELELSEMIDVLADGEADAVVAALTITSAREQQVDFTQPFYTSGLGIAVAQHPEAGFTAIVQRLFSGRFLHSVAALLGLLTLIAVLIWLAERRRNAHFHGGPARGIGSGLWWSAVTMTTVGYGDKAPITPIGRGIALVWMFTSVVIVSGFTAAIATALTVGELRNPIRSPNDLYGTRVITVADSTSAELLARYRVSYKTVLALPQALDQLAAGEADAVLYDKPILRFLIAGQYADSIRVLPHILQRQDYGIALPQASPLREPINLELLEITRSEEWAADLERYIGAE